jgi:hypothetical protein
MFYAYVTLIGAIGGLVLGIVVLKKNTSNPINRLFFLFTTFLALYEVLDYFFNGVGNNFMNGFGLHAAFASGALITASGVAWVVSLCKGYKRNIIAIIYIPGLLLALAALFNFYYVDNLPVIPRVTMLEHVKISYHLHSAYNVILILYAIFAIISSTLKEKGLIRKKLIYIDTGLIIFAVTALATDIILPALGNFSLNYLNNIAGLIFITLAVIAMIKFKAS